MLDLGYWPVITLVILFSYTISQALYNSFKEDIITYFKNLFRK